jgi:hypothetical protein
MNQQILQDVIYAVALALISLIGWGLRELAMVGIDYLKSKLGETNYNRVRVYAETVVKFLEQSPIYTNFDGAKKKELAKVAVVQWAQEHNLPIDDALFDKFIEAAVHEMNSQFGQIDWAEVGPEALTGSVASYGSAS